MGRRTRFLWAVAGILICILVVTAAATAVLPPLERFEEPLPFPDGMVVSVLNHAVTVKVDLNPFQTRHDSTIKMLQIVHSEFKHLAPANATYYIYTGDTADKVEHRPNQKVLSYSTQSSRPDCIAIPDFSFYHWPEVGLPAFRDFYLQTAANQRPFPNRSDKLFWIGANTHPDRRRMVDICENRPDTDVSFSSESRRVSIGDHGDYKYLLDVRGAGWSGRLKYLLLLGSVVFVVDRPDRQYYWEHLVPWTHYVPVAADGSNLLDHLEQLKSDQALAERIAAAGRQRALELFEHRRLYTDFAKILSGV